MRDFGDLRAPNPEDPNPDEEGDSDDDDEEKKEQAAADAEAQARWEATSGDALRNELAPVLCKLASLLLARKLSMRQVTIILRTFWNKGHESALTEAARQYLPQSAYGILRACYHMHEHSNRTVIHDRVTGKKILFRDPQQVAKSLLTNTEQRRLLRTPEEQFRADSLLTLWGFLHTGDYAFVRTKHNPVVPLPAHRGTLLMDAASEDRAFTPSVVMNSAFIALLMTFLEE